MKINIILPFAGLSGGIKVAAIYARQLALKGHEVSVISQPDTISPRTRLRELVKRGNWLRPRDVSPFLDDPLFRHITLTNSCPPTDSDVPDGDVVIATWWETAEWVASLGPQKGRKFYLLQGYEVFPGLPVDRVIATYRLPLRKIAVSRYVQECLRNNHGVSEIEIVLNGVDTTHFETPPRPRNATMTLGFLYQTHPVKNIGLALAAVEMARRRISQFRVVAFGASPPTPDLPLPDGVEFHLRPDQALIPQIYASCDAWLFTSQAEGFGLPILEAMASRTPVVATSAGAAPDLIDGQNGFIVNAEPRAFVDRIENLSRMSDTEWRNLSDHAYRTARNHSWEDSADRLERLLTES